jgi:hypothetical protein
MTTHTTSYPIISYPILSHLISSYPSYPSPVLLSSGPLVEVSEGGLHWILLGAYLYLHQPHLHREREREEGGGRESGRVGERGVCRERERKTVRNKKMLQEDAAQRAGTDGIWQV